MQQKNLETSFSYLARYVYCTLEDEKTTWVIVQLDTSFDSLSSDTKKENAKKSIEQEEKVTKCIY
jgi:hypothetical protein